MKLRIRIVAIASAMFCTAIGASAQTDTSKVYIFLKDMPDAGVYLPPPPDTASLVYADDIIQWQWGKMQRDTPRGALANYDGKWGHEVVAEIYSSLFGFEISEKNTPAIWKFLMKTSYTGNSSTSTAKRKYMRTRPFAQFNESTWSEYDNAEDLRHNGSYPSGHTSLFWTISLAFAEMVPELQDTILQRAYQYSESRVIVGAHYQSDVDAGRLAASAAFARLHTSPYYLADLKAARKEFDKFRKFENVDASAMPKGKFLGEPVDTINRRFYGDVVQYWQAKAERGTERGRQAIADAECSDEAFLSIFSQPMGITLNQKTTPAIAALMAEARKSLLSNAETLKKTSEFRKRPYVQLAEPTLIPAAEGTKAEESSFPSANAEMGWGLAMLLVEIAPEHQNDILKRGFEYGRSRVIAGYNYATDVQSGRLMAAAVMAHLHANPDFMKLVEKAKNEYSKKIKK